MGDSIDLSGDGGVLKTILRKGKADAICPSEDLPLVDGMLCFRGKLVILTGWLSAHQIGYEFLLSTVQYEGMLAESGEVFDTTREDNTVFSFELWKGSVIQAGEIAVKTMKV